MTRDLEVAKSYLFKRHADAPDARHGLLASSRDKMLEPDWGIPNGWHSTQRVQFGPWDGEGDGALFPPASAGPTSSPSSTRARRTSRPPSACA